MQIDRTRDLIIFKKGSTVVVTVSPSLAAQGWAGGQGVQWFGTGSDELAVTASDGWNHGFLLWGSDESSDQHTSMTRQQPTYQYAVMGFGGWVVATTNFERFTLASGRTLPIVYTAEDDLYFSLNGLWTNEDEWSVSGDPRAPNTNPVGSVIQAPSSQTNDYLTVQVRI